MVESFLQFMQLLFHIYYVRQNLQHEMMIEFSDCEKRNLTETISYLLAHRIPYNLHQCALYKRYEVRSTVI